ncbi:helix-turn-helix transcriptional regulator, partial [Streptomyces sp. NPDC001657]|uniref:helix-turn-helix transcriptional regulator n=1 Tax=Streptomyces sp. NPDC001657 TaxID=3154522 RepID=UPI003323DE70
MASEQDALFASVDALLAQAGAPDALPEPAERKRLREAAGLSQDQVATALSVRRETITSWEAGRTEPRQPKRAAYLRLLEGLAERFPGGAGAVDPLGPAAAAPGPPPLPPPATPAPPPPTSGPPPPP